MDILALTRRNDGELSAREADLVSDWVMANYSVDMDTSEFGDVAQETFDLIQEEEEAEFELENRKMVESWDAPYRHMV